MTLSETVFSQVAPLGRLPTPKYSDDGRAYRDRTGTTNRIPSAEATSPASHTRDPIGTAGR